MLTMPPPPFTPVAKPQPPPPLGESSAHRWPKLVTAFVVVALVAISGLVDVGALLVVPIVFVLVVPLEKLFPRHRGQKVRRPGWRTDIAYALAAPALNAVTIAVALVVSIISLVWVPGLLLRPLVAMIPAVAAPVVGIALFDLTSYWAHRWAHEVPMLWRFHSVHHSPASMDWVSGFRNHPAEGAVLAPPFVFLIAAGIDGTLAGGLVVVQIFLGLLLHANVRWRMRPLHRVLVTPEFHHWHHSNTPAAHHTNYSIFLPVWDIVFGTYRMPRSERPAVYGIDEPMPPTMAGQLWWPLRDVGRPSTWSARRARRAVATLVRGVTDSCRRPRQRYEAGN